MSDTTLAVIAIAAAVAAGLALLLALAFYLKLRRVRQAQVVLLGTGRDDLVDFAVSLQARIDDLHRAVDEVAAVLAGVDRRLDGAISRASLVRYDAYGDLSGRQSSTLALLDTHRSGVVISSILHREQARVYVKQIHEGESELELSPEEQEAIDQALAAEPAGA